MTKKEKALLKLLADNLRHRAEVSREGANNFTSNTMEGRMRDSGAAYGFETAASYIESVRDGHTKLPKTSDLLKLNEK